MPTRLEIEEEALRILAQKDPEVSMVPLPLHGSIHADGDRITCPSLDRGTIQVNRFDGRIIKVVDDATAVAYNAAVTVTGAHTATTTALTVNATGDISVGHIIEVNSSEKMLVRAIVSATELTVTRGYQGTTAVALVGAETVRYDPFGFSTGVDDSGFAAGGILTISPNFPDVTDNIATLYGAGSFHMYPRGLHPDYLMERINGVLRNTDAPYIWFPSLVPDSDFAANSIAGWTDVVAAVQTFETGAEEMLFGERYLLITPGAAADNGVRSGAFDTHEGEQLLVSVHHQTTGPFQFQLYNATASTITKTVTILNERVSVEVMFRETVPTDAVQMYLRWLSTDASQPSISVSSPVVVQSDRRRTYVTPSWFTRPSQLIEALAFPQGYSSDVADSYISLSRDALAVARPTFIRSDRDANRLRVELNNPWDYPIALLVMRPFAELAGDSSNTNADKDYVALKAVSNILRDRGDTDWKHWAGRARDRASMLGYGGRSVQVEESLVYT